MTDSDSGRVLTAIVVDDERLARDDLTAMLGEYPDIRVVGHADDVATAARLIKRLDPDVVFLDIQMPGESGFDLLNRVEIRGHVIFVTAYDEYAIRAFEVNALDYLLKPVVAGRLSASLGRLASARREEELGARKLRYDDSLFVRMDDSMRFLKVSTIVAITAAGDYTEVILPRGDRGLIDKSMSEWEARLPADKFCRVHRSAIVNLAHVERVEKRTPYSYSVVLKGLREPFPMSRRCAARLKHHLQ